VHVCGPPRGGGRVRCSAIEPPPHSTPGPQSRCSGSDCWGVPRAPTPPSHGRLPPSPPSPTHAPPRNIFPIWALGLYRRLVLGGAKRLSAEARRAGEAAGWVCAVSDYYTA
jgi:hypothetical protein